MDLVSLTSIVNGQSSEKQELRLSLLPLVLSFGTHKRSLRRHRLRDLIDLAFLEALGTLERVVLDVILVVGVLGLLLLKVERPWVHILGLQGVLAAGCLTLRLMS